MKKSLAVLSMVVIAVLSVSCAGPVPEVIQPPETGASSDVPDWSNVGDQWVLMDLSGDVSASQLTDAQMQAINEAIAAREHLLTGY